MKTEPVKCCGKNKATPGCRMRTPCTKRGTVLRDGLAFCRVHDPVARKEKQAERDRLYDINYKRQKDSREHAARCVRACEGLKDPVNQIQALVMAGLSIIHEIDSGDYEALSRALTPFIERDKAKEPKR